MDIYPLNVVPAPLWMIFKILFLFMLFALIKLLFQDIDMTNHEIGLENIFTILTGISSINSKLFILFDKLPKVNI